jgi:hypothetical protein
MISTTINFKNNELIKNQNLNKKNNNYNKHINNRLNNQNI